MTKIEFITQLETKTCFGRIYNNDDEWRELMNYAEYIWDEIIIDNEEVTFTWEDWYWGGRDYKSEKYSFDEFVRLYECDGLK